MAIDCLKILSDSGVGHIDLVVYDSIEETPQSHVKDICAKLVLDCLDARDINDPVLVAEIASKKPDLIFNINSFKILRKQLLAVPRVGIINFHNGPLPLYGGLNVCSWAILEGALEYGVSWVLIDDGIDTGDVVAQKKFPLNGGETVLALTMRCITEGIGIFSDLVERLRLGKLDRKSQDPSLTTYYSGKMIPNEGKFPFTAGHDEMERYVRALSFSPMQNGFFLPRFDIDGSEYSVRQLTLTDRDAFAKRPGLLVSLQNDALLVACRDDVVEFLEVEDSQSNLLSAGKLAAKHGLVPGETRFSS